MENYKDSSEKIEKKHSEIVARLVSDIDYKEKAWKVKEQTLEKYADQLQTELEASKRKVGFQPGVDFINPFTLYAKFLGS